MVTIVNNKDKTIEKINYEFVLAPVQLSNFISDTLKYITMTCSWNVIFTTNKKTASMTGWACDNNFPTIFTIAPQKSFTYNIPLLIEKKAIINIYTFKIGMYLFKPNEHRVFGDFDNFLDSFLISNFSHSRKPFDKNLI